MLLLFSIKLVKLKIVWIARILEIDLFGDGGSSYFPRLAKSIYGPIPFSFLQPLDQATCFIGDDVIIRSIDLLTYFATSIAFNMPPVFFIFEINMSHLKWQKNLYRTSQRLPVAI